MSLSLAADGAALCYGAREAGRNKFRLFHTDLTTGRTTFLAEAFGGVISRTGRRVAYLLTRTGSSPRGKTPRPAVNLLWPFATSTAGNVW